MRSPIVRRIGFYIGAVVFGALVWAGEVHMQNRPQVYGQSISALNPLQEKQLDAFLDMNRLLITLGTTLLGAMGFLLANRPKALSSPRGLWGASASALFVGFSMYYGYRAYEDIVLMLQPPYPSFDLTSSLIAWDRAAHFCTFVLGAFFFADFAFHELSKEEGERDRLPEVARP